MPSDVEEEPVLVEVCDSGGVMLKISGSLYINVDPIQ